MVLCDPDAWRSYTKARLYISAGVVAILPAAILLAAWLDDPDLGHILEFLVVLSVVTGSYGGLHMLMWARSCRPPGIYQRGVDVVQTRLVKTSVWHEFIRYGDVTAEPTWRGLELRTRATGDRWTVLRELFGTEGLIYVARMIEDPKATPPVPRLRVYPTGDMRDIAHSATLAEARDGPGKV